MKKLFIFTLIVFTSMNFVSAYALSAFDAGSVNSNLVEDLRIHEAMNRININNNKIKKNDTNEERNKEINEGESQVLSDIKYVSFVNNFSIPSKELYIVIQKYLNQPMTRENISLIRKDIMRYYQQKGYYSALAMITSENLQTGEIVIDIKEGGKNSITIQNEF